MTYKEGHPDPALPVLPIEARICSLSSSLAKEMRLLATLFTAALLLLVSTTAAPAKRGPHTDIPLNVPETAKLREYFGPEFRGIDEVGESRLKDIYNERKGTIVSSLVLSFSHNSLNFCSHDFPWPSPAPTMTGYLFVIMVYKESLEAR